MRTPREFRQYFTRPRKKALFVLTTITLIQCTLADGSDLWVDKMEQVVEDQKDGWKYTDSNLDDNNMDPYLTNDRATIFKDAYNVQSYDPNWTSNGAAAPKFG